jgi:transcriptional regulator with XRE-family HTH domain
MQMTMRIDGAKLRRLRLERFLDVGEVAERAGLNPYTITKMEHGGWPGGSKPSTVRKLAEALEVDPHELLVEEAE